MESGRKRHSHFGTDIEIFVSKRKIEKELIEIREGYQERSIQESLINYFNLSCFFKCLCMYRASSTHLQSIVLLLVLLAKVQHLDARYSFTRQQWRGEWKDRYRWRPWLRRWRRSGWVRRREGREERPRWWPAGTSSCILGFSIPNLASRRFRPSSRRSFHLWSQTFSLFDFFLLIINSKDSLLSKLGEPRF